MNKDGAVLPVIISKNKAESLWLLDVLSVALGVLLVSALAQVRIFLPWTPVPITGQTFGVALMALSWGRKRGLAVMITYISAGALGLPVFATAASATLMAPSLGYLLGMCVAAYWMGLMADLGWTKSFFKTWLVAASGSLIIYACGVLVLSQFVPSNQLLALGVFPFLIGDFLKTLAASALAKGASTFFSQR